MKNTTRFNPLLVFIHIVCLFVLSYTLIIKSIFSSTDSLNNHLKQAGLYADISNIVKSEVSSRLQENYRERIVLRALADKLLDAIVTPQFVEQRSQRVLTAATKIIDKPLDIANNKVVVDTKEYKQRIAKELEGRQLPEFIAPTVQNLVTSVPDTLTLVDMEKRPNSILGYLTKAKILFEHITFWNTVSLVVGILTGVLLIIFNFKNIRRLFKSLASAYLIAGIIVLLGSYLFPYLVVLYNSGPNLYLNKLVSDAAYYLFAETRVPSILYLGLGGIFYLIYRWSYTDKLQRQLDILLNKSTSQKKKKT